MFTRGVPLFVLGAASKHLQSRLFTRDVPLFTLDAESKHLRLRVFTQSVVLFFLVFVLFVIFILFYLICILSIIEQQKTFPRFSLAGKGLLATRSLSHAHAHTPPSVLQPSLDPRHSDGFSDPHQPVRGVDNFSC